MKRNLFPAALASVLTTVACAHSAWAHPDGFSNLSFKEASNVARKEHKILIADFMASWCGPCKHMDATTWSKSDVRDWIQKNAIAVQIDVDQEKKLASEFKINAMPTVIAFAADDQQREFERKVGYQNAAGIIAWLDNVKAGKRNVAQTQDTPAQEPQDTKAEIQTRYKRARGLVLHNQYAEATDEFVWLWNNIRKLDPSMIGVRSSFMASEMKQTAANYPPARERFEALRSDAKKLDDPSDWFVLNGILNEEAKSLAWFDEVKKQPDAQNKFKSVDFILERLLARDNRWADIGNYLYQDPITKLREQYEFGQLVQAFSRKHDPSGVLDAYDPFRKSAGILYGSLLAAGRKHKADELASEALRLEDTFPMRCSLVQTAFKAKQLGPDQLKLIEDVGPNIKKDEAFYKTRSYVYSEMKMPDKALKDADELMKLAPANPQGYLSRARILFDAKEYKKSIADLDQAIAIDPKSPVLFVERGYASHKMNNDKAALEDMAHAVELDPRSIPAFVATSDIYFHQGKYQDAFDAASKAVAVDPEDTYALTNRGEAVLRLGRYDEAVLDLTRGVEGDSVTCSAEACYYRAQAYEKLGKPDLAKVDRETAEKLGFSPEPESK